MFSQSPPDLPQIEQGKAIIDACKSGGADFVVFCSVMACDTAPAAAKHIRHVDGGALAMLMGGLTHFMATFLPP